MTNGTDTGWMGTSLCRGLGGNRRTHPFHPLPPQASAPVLVSPGAHRRCSSPSCNPGRGRGSGRGSGLAVPGCGPRVAALRLRTLLWEAGSLGVPVCKAAGGSGRSLGAMQMREAGSARGSASLPRSWGQRCQAQLVEWLQLGE